MAAGNQVTITFAGDEKPAVESFNRVGAAARDMDNEVRGTAGGFDRAAEAADSAEGKAQGFASTLTGTADVAAGTGAILKGNLYEGFVLAGGGLADLAEGFSYTLIPAMRGAVTWMGQTRIGMAATAVWTKVWAAAQAILNAVMMLNPVYLIVAAIVVLIAIIVLIAVKTDWFSQAWNASWGWIKSTAMDVWEWLKGLPDRIGSAFARIAGLISAPFRAAFNFVSDAWNNTIGRMHWSVPNWVPGIGGNSISAPRLPKFHGGGTVPGPPGSEMLAILQAGEEITPRGSSGGGGVLAIGSDGSRLGDLLVDVLAVAIKKRGGDVQLVLGVNRG